MFLTGGDFLRRENNLKFGKSLCSYENFSEKLIKVLKTNSYVQLSADSERLHQENSVFWQNVGNLIKNSIKLETIVYVYSL